MAVMILAILLLVFSGPATAQSSLYQFREFTVILEKYPHTMNPVTKVQITLDGKGEFHRVIRGDSIEIEQRKDFELTVNQLENLYYNIMRCNFFELSTVYGTPENCRGEIVHISVKIDNQLHSVTMYDERYLAVDMVVDAILDSIPAQYADAFRKEFDPARENFQIKLE